MILHLSKDEKFIDSTIWQFDQVAPGKSHYVLIVQDKNKLLKYIKSSDRVETIEYDSEEYHNLVNTFSKYKAIIVHGIYYNYARLINKANKKIPIYGVLLGADIYNAFSEYNKINFLPLTKKFFKPAAFQYKLKNVFRPYYYYFAKRKEPINKTLRKSFKRLNYLSALFTAAETFHSSHGLFSAKFFQFTYYPIEYIISGNIDLMVTKESKNILLGNSSSITNNHVDAFDLLSKFDLEDKKVITPLSYGDEKYREELIPIGNKYLGENFKPLIRFMDIDSYNEIISSCGIVIMNHLRSQAFGNIAAMLWMGAKVYMHEQSILYKGLKEKGLKLFSITNDLVPSNPKALQLLDKEIVELNRKILYSFLSKKAVLAYTNNLVKEIYSN